ncbi:MAG: NAD(P)-dependent oxidoreductase [Dehalococcoidia bacterium]|nr:MAG: NAD(P)-dependent oxidoreductase [Chloroflexota bacterium]
MRILLLGATKGLGKEILKEALSLGFEINCLVRNTKKFPVEQNNIRVFEGDATSSIDLENAVQDSKIIISTLNVMRKNLFPWSNITNDKNTISKSSKNIIEISKRKKIKHLISVSAWGVNESLDHIPIWFKLLIKNSNLKYPYIDHGKSEKLLVNSNLNWTILRPSALVNFLNNHQVKESISLKNKPSLIISRKSLAKFIINIVDKKNYYNKIVTVSKK